MKCEYPGEHARGCNGVGYTRDHLTPRCIARAWKWSRKQMDSPENIQWLSRECHNIKDKPTPEKLYWVKRGGIPKDVFLASKI
jgi:hypothetical protein